MQTNQIEHEVRDIDIIVSKGNNAGDVTYANPIFYKLSGYTQGELLDRPHSILRHPDMPKVIFNHLWENLDIGKDVKVFVKNLTKDGGFYWVYAHIRVALNPDGSFRNFVSTRRKMSQKARKTIEPLYTKLLEAENEAGMNRSLEILSEFLENNGESLHTFNNYMERINKDNT